MTVLEAGALGVLIGWALTFVWAAAQVRRAERLCRRQVREALDAVDAVLGFKPDPALPPEEADQARRVACQVLGVCPECNGTGRELPAAPV